MAASIRYPAPDPLNPLVISETLVPRNGQWQVTRPNPDPKKTLRGPTYPTITEAKEFVDVTPADLRYGRKDNPLALLAGIPLWGKVLGGLVLVTGVGIAGVQAKRRFWDKPKKVLPPAEPIPTVSGLVPGGGQVLLVLDRAQPDLEAAFHYVGQIRGIGVGVVRVPVEVGEVRKVDLTPATNISSANRVDAIIFAPSPVDGPVQYTGKLWTISDRVVNVFPPGVIPSQVERQRFATSRANGGMQHALTPTIDPDDAVGFAQQVLGDLVTPDASSKARLI